MKPDGALKLVSQLLDLPILDQDGNYCGIVDDVEMKGGPGKPLELKALLVGPGAYAGRLPAWAMGLVKAVAGDRMTRVPIGKVRTIDRVVHLDCTGGELGLNKSETVVERWIPKTGAL
jgi:sporulation protein YlmC with PRC-barrel domain